MPGDKTDLSPEMTPGIRLKGDMIGIHIPGLSRTKLVSGPVAFELGMTLVRLGKRLEQVHAAAVRDAESHAGELTEIDDPEQAKAEHKAFVHEAMMARLRIDAEDDLDLDEDYMEGDETP